MDEYDSDDSLSDVGSGVATNVLLGYASKEPTEDAFSQLGGVPTWLHPAQHAPPQVVKCKSCSDYMSLLLQLNGDLPSKFPGHERRLYIWGCRKKTCRRKDGSVRAVRGVRLSKQALGKANTSNSKQNSMSNNAAVEGQSSRQDVGGTLFGAKSAAASSQANPFASSAASNPFSTSTTSASTSANPFATAPAPPSTLAAKPPQRPATTSATAESLPETFAQKARISSPSAPPPQTLAPWPPESAFPTPYPSYHLDADYEYLSPSASSDSASASASNGKYAALMDNPPDADPTTDPDASTSRKASSSSNTPTATTTAADTDDTPHDKAFLHFADTLAQNPEQVLRYEFGGQPLLYTRRDAVGRAFSAAPGSTSASTSAGVNVISGGTGMPRCSRCGAGRVFELQVTPYAIVELEAEDEGDGDVAGGLDGEGMEWGTVILGVCGADCGGGNVAEFQGEVEWAEEERVRYVEEWVGVQWEEVVDTRGGARRRG